MVTSSIVGIAGLVVLLPFAQCALRIPGELRKSRVEAARVGAETIRTAAELHMEHDGVSRAACPTIEDLVVARRLERGRAEDSWGRPYRIACVDGRVRVASDGRDGAPGTVDDVVASSAPARNSNGI